MRVRIGVYGGVTKLKLFKNCGVEFFMYFISVYFIVILQETRIVEKG